MVARSKVAVALVGTAILATACVSGSETSGDEAISIAIEEPNNLFPTSKFSTADSGQIVDQLFTGLVEIENGKPVLRVAKSITSDDQTTWDITLRKGWTFHNGEPVDADSFIRAWNWTAYGPNAATDGPLFSRFEGYEQMQGGEPKAKSLAGLKKVNDYEFQVTLNAPYSQFTSLLANTSAFAPMSQQCLKNMAACNEGKLPLGNGPWMMDGRWKHNEEIPLRRWEDYPGPDAAQADRLTFKIYENMETAFRDYQAGNLDIVQPTPAQVEQARSVAGDNTIEGESSSFTYLGLPLYVDYLKDPDVRHALSLAIDRQAIIDNLIAGLGTPAQAMVSPSVPGGGGDHCDYCEYDPDRAQQLMEKSGGLPDTITLWVDSGAGNTEWVQAVGDQWKDVFGIDYVVKALPFSKFVEKVVASDFSGPYRLGWEAEYPSMLNYLDAPWFSDAPTNKGVQYHNPKFESLVNQGSAAKSESESIKYYSQAEDVFLEDMPIIPMYYDKAFYAYSDRLANVQYEPTQGIDLSAITVG